MHVTSIPEQLRRAGRISTQAEARVYAMHSLGRHRIRTLTSYKHAGDTED